MLGSTMVGAPAAAKQGDSLAQQIREASAELSKANGKVRRSLSALAAVQERLDRANTKLSGAQARERSARTQAREATAAAASARTAIRETVGRKRAVQRRIDTANAGMASLVRAVYQQGPLGQVAVVLEAQDPGDLTARLAAVEAVARSQEDTLLDLAAGRADLAYEVQRERDLAQLALDEEREAKEQLEAAEAARIEADEAADEVAELAQERQDALDDARDYRDDVARELEELKREQDRVQQEAQGAAEADNRPEPNPGRGFAWPVTGARLTQGPGPRIHPVYGYRSCHTGIDLGAGTGTPIRATADGTVVSVRNGGPYGLHTLISHGGRITSFYAHQSRTAVNAGDRVREGEVIGYVGSTGWSTGPHLHFEIHVGGRPYDPRGWFGSSRRTVGC